MARKENPMTMISIRLPKDMVTKLKEIAPRLGETGYQPLIRTYIEQGLITDLVRVEQPNESDYIEELAKVAAGRKQRSVSEAPAEYTTDHPTEFVIGMPTEWSVAVAEESEGMRWGENLVALLKGFDETGWEDVRDPVVWVEESRRKRMEAREAQK